MPEVANLSAKVTGDTKDFDAAMKRADAGISGFVSGAGRVGGALGGIATTTAVAATALGGLAVAGFGAVVKTSAEFSHSMSDVGAATQATGAELSDLRGLALALGKDVQLAGVDATTAAQAIAELGRGGVTTGELMDGAAKGGLLLFSAGAKSVDSAAQVAIAAMSNFGLAGNQVGHVADVMAAGANKSATSVDELGSAFNQSAAVAHGAGLTFEELAGTLSYLAQKGLQGSDAGTSLKTALQRLQAPTDVAAKTMADLGITVRDAEGHMLPMAQIADVLKARLGGLSDAQRDAALQTIFGADAIRVALPLIAGGGDAIREWTDKVNDAGYAAKIGAQKNDDLFGSFEQLKATISTSAIEVGQKFEPALRKATDAGAKFLTDFLANPAVQRGIDQFATDFGTSLDAIIAKLSDPTFQAEMREWAVALGDTAKAAVSLAGTIKDVLGPPVIAAVGWFNDLDESGKRNVVTFGLLAVAVAKLAGPLATLASAGSTAAKVLASLWGAVPAGTIATTTAAVAAGTAATVAASAAWAAQIAVLVKYRDATGGTAAMQQQFTLAQEAMTLAMLHGAAAGGEVNTGFVRYVQSLPTVITNVDDLAIAWNRYVNGVSLAGQSTQGLTLATTAQQQALAATTTAHRDAQAGVAGYNSALVGAVVAAQALGATLPGINQGLAAGATAAAGLAVPVQASALALQELNSYGTSAQAGLNNVASGALAASQNLATVTQQAQNYATAQAIAESDTGEFGTALGILSGKILAVGNSFAETTAKLQGLNSEHGQLSGWLQTLQKEWDDIDVAIQKTGVTTAEQKARQQELAPTIEAINGLLGVNATQTTNATLEAFKLWQQQQGLNTAYGTTSAAVNTHTSAITGMTSAVAAASVTNAAHQTALAATRLAFGGVTSAANDGVVAQNANASAMATTTGAATTAAGAIAGVGTAIRVIPKDFTVTAHVNISGALAAIAELDRNMPHSPAKEGPFRVLPNWDALFETLPEAARGALGETIDAMSPYLASFRRLGRQIFGTLPEAAGIEGETLRGTMTATLDAVRGVIDVRASEFFASGVMQVRNMANGWQDQLPGLLNEGKRVADGLLGWFGNAAGRFEATGSGLLGSVAQGWTERAPDLAAEVRKVAGDVFQATREIGTNLDALTARLGSGGMAATGVKSEAAAISETLGDGLSAFDRLLPLKDKPSAALAAVGVSMDDALSQVGGLVTQAKLVREDALDFLWNAQQAADAIAKGLQILGGLPNGGGGSDFSRGSGGPFISQIGASVPALASGGIVTKPMLALVGERGPEAVVPLSQYGRGGGGGGGAMYVTIEYHDHTMQGTDRARLAQFARDLKPELEGLVVTSW